MTNKEINILMSDYSASGSDMNELKAEAEQWDNLTKTLIIDPTECKIYTITGKKGEKINLLDMSENKYTIVPNGLIWGKIFENRPEAEVERLWDEAVTYSKTVLRINPLESDAGFPEKKVCFLNEDTLIKTLGAKQKIVGSYLLKIPCFERNLAISKGLSLYEWASKDVTCVSLIYRGGPHTGKIYAVHSDKYRRIPISRVVTAIEKKGLPITNWTFDHRVQIIECDAGESGEFRHTIRYTLSDTSHAAPEIAHVVSYKEGTMFKKSTMPISVDNIEEALEWAILESREEIHLSSLECECNSEQFCRSIGLEKAVGKNKTKELAEQMGNIDPSEWIYFILELPRENFSKYQTQQLSKIGDKLFA